MQSTGNRAAPVWLASWMTPQLPYLVTALGQARRHEQGYLILGLLVVLDRMSSGMGGIKPFS